MILNYLRRKVAQVKMARRKDELLDNLISSISNITNAEVEIYDYVSELNIIQEKIHDIEHYLEYKPITRNGAINLIKLLQDLRIERRQIKQMWEIWNVYGTGREKLKQKDYRDRLIAELRKKDKELQTQYKYRQFEEQYLDLLNEDKPLPKGRKPKKVTYNNIEEEEEGKG